MRPDLRAYLLGDDGRRVFGPGPVDLLERVGELGSLRAAAIEMGMAYTKATRLVHDAERAFGFALTERTVGGSGGGGSQLTAEVRELIGRYRAFERTSRAALSAAYETCFSGFGGVARLGCVVMASGEGARFGGAPGEKLVAPLAGTAVLERTLAALPGDLLDVVVVTRWDAVDALCERLGVRCVRAEGPLKSDTVRAGLAALGHRAGCLFVTGDQPLLTEGSVRAMVAALTREPNLEQAVAVNWEGRYLLCFGDNCYVLDGNQKRAYRSQSENDYVYECYHWNGIPARCFLEVDGALFFGTAEGAICRFNNDLEGVMQYHDNGSPIVCQWSTKADDDGDFLEQKRLLPRGLAIQIKPFERGSVSVLLRTEREDESCVLEQITDIFSFDRVDFSRFVFNATDSPQVVPIDARCRNYLTLQIIVKSDGIYEGLGVLGIIKRFSRGRSKR